MVDFKTDITYQGATFEQVREFMENSARFDTSGGLQSCDDVFGGCVFMKFVAGSEVLGACALRLRDHSGGRELWIIGLSLNLRSLNDWPFVMEIVEAVARRAGAKCLTILTRRGGGVKRALSLGFEQNAVMMRKLL